MVASDDSLLSATGDDELVGGGNQRSHQFVLYRGGIGDGSAARDLILAQPLCLADIMALGRGDDCDGRARAKVEAKRQRIE